MADTPKELKEKQTSNLLKAIELKNAGISNGKLARIVDYVIDHEIAELQYDVVLFDRGNVKTMDYNFHKEDGRCMKN